MALKYTSEEDLQHFFKAIGNHYKYHYDPQGKNYIGLKSDWHYDTRYVDLSMPGYINSLLHRLQHTTPTRPEYSPHDYTPFTYTKKNERQLATAPDLSAPITDTKEIKRIQSIIGSLLYYGRSLDNTILPAPNEISIL